MSCIICGKNSCSFSFHSIEEQEFFDRASDAFDRFIEIRDECRKEWEERGVDNQIEEEQEK